MMMKFACCTWSNGWATKDYDVYRMTSDLDLCPHAAVLEQWLREKGYDPG